MLCVPDGTLITFLLAGVYDCANSCFAQDPINKRTPGDAIIISAQFNCYHVLNRNHRLILPISTHPPLPQEAELTIVRKAVTRCVLRPGSSL